jgi:hypothetical protein
MVRFCHGVRNHRALLELGADTARQRFGRGRVPSRRESVAILVKKRHRFKPVAAGVTVP